MGFYEACRLVTCARCGAAANEPCRTTAGRTRPPGQYTAWPHAARVDVVRAVLAETGIDDDLHEAWEDWRALHRAIRELHRSIDGTEQVDAAWLRVRLAELLNVRADR